MVKVRDVYPSTPHMPLDTTSLRSVTLRDVWARYDGETDSMIVYSTGKPVAGVNVYLGDDVYAIVDTRVDTRGKNKVVGLYFESWQNYVPKVDIVNRSWREIQEAARHGKDVTLAVRVLALDLLMSIGTEDIQALQLA